MNLSEAILIGCALRPESHQERFCYVENRGLCSDIWGAACEAVHPQVAKLNWNLSDKQALNSALRYLNEIQHRYFERYFTMPAVCPMASRSIMRGHGRILNRKGEYAVDPGAKLESLPGVTDECSKVKTLAGFVDHAFYKHGNSREEIAAMVGAYEETQDRRVLLAVEHHKSARLMQRTAEELTGAAIQRARARVNGRKVFTIN